MSEVEKHPVREVHVYVDRSGEYRWRAVAVNGRIVADSAEGYVNYEWARGMAARMFGHAQIVDMTGLGAHKDPPPT